MTTEIHIFEWRGIEIELIHKHKYFGVIEHLTIQSIKPLKAKLPITETGFKSHFVDESAFDGFDSPLAYVQAWLEHEAAKPHWQTHTSTANQYSLF